MSCLWPWNVVCFGTVYLYPAQQEWHIGGKWGKKRWEFHADEAAQRSAGVLVKISSDGALRIENLICFQCYIKLDNFDDFISKTKLNVRWLCSYRKTLNKIHSFNIFQSIVAFKSTPKIQYYNVQCDYRDKSSLNCMTIWKLSLEYINKLQIPFSHLKVAQLLHWKKLT